MEGKELSIVLRELARSQKVGLCDGWYSSWRDDTDIDTLLDMFVRGQDFCIENDYPSLSFIRDHFSAEDLHRHHIYVDESADLTAENGYYIFLGRCSARLVASGFMAVSVYCRHDSTVDVSASLGARVFVSSYDRSHVSFHEESGGKVRYYDRHNEKEGGS